MIEGMTGNVSLSLEGMAALIEKINQLSDGRFQPHKARQEVRAAQARINGVTAMFSAQGIVLTEEERRAILFAATRSVKGFENIESIVRSANIPKNAPTAEIEDEWLSRFLDGAKNAYSEWARQVYKEILETESCKPGSISMAALLKVIQLGQREIAAFKKICSTSYCDGRKLIDPVILSLESHDLEILGLERGALTALHEIGLIMLKEESEFLPFGNVIGIDAASPIMGDLREEPGSARTVTIYFIDGPITVPCALRYNRKHSFPRLNRGANLGFVSFTSAGRELANSFSCRQFEEMDSYVATMYGKISAAESDLMATSSAEFREAVERYKINTEPSSALAGKACPTR